MSTLEDSIGVESLFTKAVGVGAGALFVSGAELQALIDGLVEAEALIITAAGAGALTRNAVAIGTTLSATDDEAGAHRCDRDTLIDRMKTSTLSFMFLLKVSAKIPPRNNVNRAERELLRRAAATRYDTSSQAQTY